MSFKSLKKNKREGFTLLEMVIVVAILVILYGIVFMQFWKVQESSKKNADYAAAANLATAARLYMTDYPQEITYNNETNIAEIKIEDLQERGYINSKPQSQSKRADFNIKLVKEESDSILREELYVLSEDSLFYPKDGKLSEKLNKNEENDKEKDNDTSRGGNN